MDRTRLEIEELEERLTDAVLKGFGEDAEIFPEEIVVPGEDLIDQDRARPGEAAWPGRNADSRAIGARSSDLVRNAG